MIPGPGIRAFTHTVYLPHTRKSVEASRTNVLPDRVVNPHLKNSVCKLLDVEPWRVGRPAHRLQQYVHLIFVQLAPELARCHLEFFPVCVCVCMCICPVNLCVHVCYVCMHELCTLGDPHTACISMSIWFLFSSRSNSRAAILNSFLCVCVCARACMYVYMSCEFVCVCVYVCYVCTCECFVCCVCH